MDIQTRLRNYNDSDYEDISSWFQEWWHTLVPKSLLPKTGYIIEANSQKAAAGFLFKTDGNIAILEYVVGNPNVAARVHLRAIDQIIEQAKYDVLAHYGPAGVLMVVTDNKGFGRIVQRAGFETGNQVMSSYIFSNGNNVAALKDCEAEAINTR